jgi:hypothetical protein
VDALLNDIWSEVGQIADFMPSVLLADAKLPLWLHKRAEALIVLMAECRRLYRATELFSSAISRQDFELHLDKITKDLCDFNITSKLLLQEVEEWRKPRMVYAIKLGGMWFRLNRPRPMKKRELPHWHPLKTDGVKPWNKWLNNQNEERLSNGKHKEIKQRVPACGIKLLHRARFMYCAVRNSYSVVREISSKVEARTLLILSVQS